MMRSRLTYVPIGVAEQFAHFIIDKEDEEFLGAVKAKTRDYSLLSVLKLLYVVHECPMTFTELYAESKIRMKKSFLNYMHLCVDCGLVGRKRSGGRVTYTITEGGSMMLRLLHKGN